ncbi:MAG: hypothetical protein AAGK37_00760 [Pseudomonadota bacterium]
MSFDDFENAPATLCMISGCGRSGSNRLLDILDFSAMTACRNEPDEIRGGRLNQIGYQLFDTGLGAPEVKTLHRALIEAGTVRSERDRFDHTNKQFLTSAGKALIPVMAVGRVRKLAHAVGIMNSPAEWNLPGFSLNDAPFLPVLKLNSRPIWAEQAAKAEPNLRLVHNIRQPWDYLNSWFNRFILRNDNVAGSFTEHFGDVPRVLEFFGRDDADRLGDPSIQNIVEVELWRWRYTNERLMRLGSEHVRYLRVTYGEVDEDVLATARSLYEFLGLPITPNIETGIASMRNKIFPNPHKRRLEDDVVRAAMDIALADCPLETVFPNGFLRH